MAAKLLHSLADENPDLQKQIGCMTGIFQLFDRHHNILTARRITHKRLPPGNSHFTDGSFERDSNCLHHPLTAAVRTSFFSDVNLEKQRISTESSMASFSSSCSSSVSSLDCKAQAETAIDRIIFPETPSRDPVINQASVSPHLGRQSLELRDVVKDSMHRDARGLLSVKTATKEEAAVIVRKHRDSPRPLQLSKSIEGSYGVGIDGKQNVPLDLKESIRVLAKLREAPWYYSEARELPRSSYEVKEGHWHPISKDAPRFSYDGREIGRFSFESRDTIKCPPKLKELPRLSLDSRENSWRTHSTDSKSAQISRGSNGGTSTSDDKVSTASQSLATQSRPPSVVAKLMGLEALPDTHSSMPETRAAQDSGQFSRLSRNGLTRPIRGSNSPKTSLRDPTSPRWKNPDLVMKPISNSRFPIEPAPWKQQDGNRSSQKPSFRAIKAPAKAPDSFPSVYSEIEKRLKDLEFKQSGRDLRALKQILEAMQAKGLLQTEKEEASNAGIQRDYYYEPKSTNLIQNSRSVRQQNQPGNDFLSSTIRGAHSARNFESPIVIMKPAKLVEKTDLPASSVIPIGGLSSSHRLQNGVTVDNKKVPSSSRMAKDQSFRTTHRDAAASSTDKKASSSKIMRPAQSQPRSQQSAKECSSSSIKNSGSVSPRLQQKKLELEKRSRPPAPPSDSNKPRRQPSKKATESGSPGRKLRAKFSNLQHSGDPLSEISHESRSLSCQGDESSQQSDSITVSESKMDVEVTSSLQSAETFDSPIPSMKAMKQFVTGSMQTKSTLRLDEVESVSELATDAPEHPSPVSVLDGSAYRDDVTFPIQQISSAPKADDAQESRENGYGYQRSPINNSLVFNSTGSGEINREKLQNIDHLVQKLRRLNSTHDEARNDYIASLCENTNPDHRYISEILLASGLLLRDLSSELLTFQLHSSGHPVNPELFFVLEQTKASSLLPKEECIPEKVACLKLKTEKSHRKLIFDAVNEILGVKLALILGSSTEPWLKPSRLTKKTMSAQKLLKELCFEIEKMQAKKPESSLEDEEDGLKSILIEDVMNGSESWTDSDGDVPGVVLDVERLIFKDLVDEVVIGEAGGLRVKQGRRRKQLFGK
ncbi:protein LONGIFOLIA 2 isoform X1 [Senna tora]|uniref:Protein LONGIFOLIA 2 isoform X1 n=1 Tax=Senna tora TaxID=362788 RepID=A0A834W1X8_9FABA|nr:protein LONGIFOLIA 2 isoform X1 [Senna tora]